MYVRAHVLCMHRFIFYGFLQRYGGCHYLLERFLVRVEKINFTRKDRLIRVQHRKTAHYPNYRGFILNIRFKIQYLKKTAHFPLEQLTVTTGWGTC